MSATRQSWSNLQSLPVQRWPLSLQREFTEQEYECLCDGLIPDRMEEKWFIFLEDDILYVHRSWTGYCIYQLSLTRENSTYAISRALVNRDPNQYTWVNDHDDEKLLMFLIDHLLLGERSPLPMVATVPVGMATELYLQHVVGTGRKLFDAEVAIQAATTTHELFCSPLQDGQREPEAVRLSSPSQLSDLDGEMLHLT